MYGFKKVFTKLCFAYYVVHFFIHASLQKKWTEEITYELFGNHVSLKMIDKFESERSFNGDGYSIYVFEMSDKIIEYIINNFETIINEYPIKPDFREYWTKVGWKETPLDEKEQRFYEFCTDVEYTYYDKSSFVKNNAKKCILYFEKLVNEVGNYYSYNYLSHSYGDLESDEYVSDIDFYIFNLKEKILICINHNT